MQSWVLARLEQQTRPRQSLADNDRLTLMTGAASPDAYRAFLMRVYGFEAPVEAAIQRTAGFGGVVDIRGRAHLKLLVSDLIGLGVTVDTLPRCRNVAGFASVEDALGWAYVIERNMLLHGVLRRHLEKLMPDHLARAGSYLAGNERRVGARLRELGSALDATAKTHATADRIVVAAHAAFRCQRHWFAEVIPPRAQVA